MRILVIDTAGTRCAVGLFDVDDAPIEIVSRSEAMARGHAEALLPMVDAVMSDAASTWTVVDRIAVVRGPGSFTGVRIGIAAARGLALAAQCPAVGVTVFDALRASLGEQDPMAVALDARRGQVFVQSFDEQGIGATPAAVDIDDAVNAIPDGVRRVAGSGAAMVADATEGRLTVISEVTNANLATIATLGAACDPAVAPATPLYLRPPDAKPQTAARIARR